MNSKLQNLFDGAVGSSTDKQLNLVEVLGASDEWSVDIQSSRLQIGGFNWSIQILGSESQATSTWLWSWANTRSNFPKNAIASSDQLRSYGERNHIDEFVKPSFPMDGGVDGHFVSIIACNLLDCAAYYRAPYDGGALYLLIKDSLFPRAVVDPLPRIVSVFPQAIAAFECDHRSALAAYAKFYGLGVSLQKDVVLISSNDAPLIKARFDDMNRLTALGSARAGV